MRPQYDNLIDRTDMMVRGRSRSLAGPSAYLLVAGGLAISLIGCGQEASFNGKVGQRTAAQDAMALRSTCADSSVQISQAELAKSGGNIVLSGEFCAQSTSDLQLVFALDFSQSMVSNDPVIGSMAGASGASCGRSRAVDAIVQALRSSGGTSDQVSVGVIGFGGGAQVVVPESPLSNFNPGFATLCRSDSGSTNYQAAFESAEAALRGSVRKNKLFYFISDGMPNKGGVFNSTNIPGAMNAGRVAASRMRSNVPGLNFNALLLRSETGALTAADPQTYLTELTGDASRVRIVSEANALATQAVELLAGPVAINPGSVSARLVDANGASSNVQVLSFDRGAGSLPGLNQGASSWSFKTGSFVIPASSPGKYQLLIEGTDSSGAKKSSTVSIHVQ